jgi:phosphatidylserine/phosphatidylglycerophosphate/cardiolipin synthase-like enzyme
VKLIVQPDAGILPLVHAIRRARRAIHVAIFRFDRDEIERELEQAVARGVRVRALIAHTNRGGENRLRKLEQRLLAAGVTVARSSDDLLRYHGKFLVVDDTLHVFGFNLTKLDIDKSRSFGLATRDRRTVQEALKLFEADCTRRTYVPSRSNLVVSPESARAMLTAFIKGARRELAVYDQKIQDPAMIKLLKERAAKGVRVRVIGDLKGPDGEVLVRGMKSIRLHVRAIIRDGTRAFVGSQSLRKEELDARREVGLLISNPTVTRQLMQVFETDWKENLTPKDLKKEEKKVVVEKAEKVSEEKEKEKEKEKTKDEEKDETKEEKQEKSGA